jgi:hypothetical protein
MTLKRAIKIAYVGTGISAALILGAKQPVVLGILVAGVVLLLILAFFVVWILED